MMRKLRDIVTACKSKNAGPFELTLDMLFVDKATFDYVCKARCITPEVVASHYGIEAADVLLTEYPPALAIKATIPRKIVSGGIGDTDVYGAQQHAPLLEINVP